MASAMECNFGTASEIYFASFHEFALIFFFTAKQSQIQVLHAGRLYEYCHCYLLCVYY